MHRVLAHACNRMAGYDLKIRHRSDDATLLGAIVGSERAVALLPALFTTGTPSVTSRPAQEGTLQRTIFTVARRTARNAPAILAVRQALRQTATQVAASRNGIELLPEPPAPQPTSPYLQRVDRPLTQGRWRGVPLLPLPDSCPGR